MVNFTDIKQQIQTSLDAGNGFPSDLALDVPTVGEFLAVLELDGEFVAFCQPGEQSLAIASWIPTIATLCCPTITSTNRSPMVTVTWKKFGLLNSRNGGAKLPKAGFSVQPFVVVLAEKLSAIAKSQPAGFIWKAWAENWHDNRQRLRQIRAETCGGMFPIRPPVETVRRPTLQMPSQTHRYFPGWF